MAYMERRVRPAANHIVEERTEAEKFQRHLAKIRAVKSTLDNKPPRHSARVNVKRAYMLEERYTSIERDNLHLLSKMHSIMREPDISSRPPIGPVSLNIRNRRNDLVRITRENHVRERRTPWAAASLRLATPRCVPSARFF